MINFSYLYSQLGRLAYVNGYNEIITSFEKSDEKYLLTRYFSDIAFNELKIHRHYLLNAGVKLYGMDELIKKLVDYKSQSLVIVNCLNSEWVIKIFLDNNECIIGAFTFKKRKDRKATFNV